MSGTNVEVITFRKMLNGRKTNANSLFVAGNILFALILAFTATMTTLFGVAFLFLGMVMAVVPVLGFAIPVLEAMKKNVNEAVWDFSRTGAKKFNKRDILKLVLHLPITRSIDCGSQTLYDGQDVRNSYPDWDCVESGMLTYHASVVKNRVNLISQKSTKPTYAWDAVFQQSTQGYFPKKDTLPRKSHNS